MDFGNLLNPTSSSSKKGPEKPFRSHSLAVTKPRSIPANEAPQNVNMKPLPSDRLDLNKHVTHGRFNKWDGESSMPVAKNNSWWKGEAAGLQGTIQDQRRAKSDRRHESSSPTTTSKSAKKQQALENELHLTKDRFGRDAKDALKTGKFDEEKRQNLSDALARKTYDKYDNSRLNIAKQLDARHQYISDCNDVVHRDWRNRYSLPPQARDADAVAVLLEERGLLPTSSHYDGSTSSSPSMRTKTFRVLPPLNEVEVVYHMSRGCQQGSSAQGGGVSSRFASPFAKNERSAREGYMNNDNAIGRTTPVGDRESASNAPKLACLALATSDAKRTAEDDERNQQSGHRASFSMSRGVSVVLDNNSNNNKNNLDNTSRKGPQEKFRPADTSRTRLDNLQRPDRINIVSAGGISSLSTVQFSSIPTSVLKIMPPAGL